MSLASDLKAVRDVITEKGWTQGVSARDECGAPVYSSSKDATSFCMLGALDRTAKSAREAAAAIEKLKQATGHIYVSVYNDESCRTKEEVLAMMDKAIALTDGDNAGA